MVNLVVAPIRTPQLLGVVPATCGTPGIDKVGLTFDIDDIPTHAPGWEEYLRTGSFQQVVTDLALPSLRLRATARPNALVASVEFTPSLLLGFANNVPVASDTTTLAAVAMVLDTINDYADLVQQPLQWNDVRIARLDLVRDFQLAGPAISSHALLEAYQHRKVPYSRETKTYRDAAGRINYVFHGNKTRSAHVYDKHGESGGIAPKGTIRWEVRVRTGFLRRRGLRQLSNAHPSDLDDLRRECWKWSCMDEPFSLGPSGVAALQAAIDVGDVSASQAASALGHLFVGQDAMGKRTLDRHRAIFRDLGIPYSPDIVSETDARNQKWCIDYASGMVVPM
jgi:hypothetical protein